MLFVLFVLFCFHVISKVFLWFSTLPNIWKVKQEKQTMVGLRIMVASLNSIKAYLLDTMIARVSNSIHPHPREQHSVNII